jgi:hypothetical protein
MEIDMAVVNYSSIVDILQEVRGKELSDKFVNLPGDAAKGDPDSSDYPVDLAAGGLWQKIKDINLYIKQKNTEVTNVAKTIYSGGAGTLPTPAPGTIYADIKCIQVDVTSKQTSVSNAYTVIIGTGISPENPHGDGIAKDVIDAEARINPYYDNINTVVDNKDDMITVSDNLEKGTSSEVIAVGEDLVKPVSNIKVTATNIVHISTVANDLNQGLTSNVKVVASNLLKGTTPGDTSQSEVLAVGGDLLKGVDSAIITVNTNFDTIQDVSDNKHNINVVADDLNNPAGSNIKRAYPSSMHSQAWSKTSQSYAMQREDEHVILTSYDEANNRFVETYTNDYSAYHYMRKAAFNAALIPRTRYGYVPTVLDVGNMAIPSYIPVYKDANNDEKYILVTKEDGTQERVPILGACDVSGFIPGDKPPGLCPQD